MYSMQESTLLVAEQVDWVYNQKMDGSPWFIECYSLSCIATSVQVQYSAPSSGCVT
uniref:Uncharacterized protein n=1 Tax=Rhizophora mucronata TaxID=61149 RepID=A0A2P2Q168_RHIMU